MAAVTRRVHGVFHGMMTAHPTVDALASVPTADAALRELDLDDTGLDRRGLAGLVGNRTLRRIGVGRNPALTGADVRSFRAAMPAVEIDGADHPPCQGCPDRSEPREPVFPGDGFG
jgi:hypothetical protein